MSEASPVSITFKSDPHAYQRLSEKDLSPKDVLADLLGEELPLDNPEEVAQMIIERLADAGFVLWPYELPKPPKA